MRKVTIKKIIMLIILTVIAPLIFLAYYCYNNRLFLVEAEFLWDSKKFNETDFRNGTSNTRASMVTDLIRSKKFIGVKCESITESLGEETGDYYQSDSNSTYKLTENPSANWILTFICGDSGKVEKVFIRKSCCSASQKLLYQFISAIDFFFKK